MRLFLRRFRELHDALLRLEGDHLFLLDCRRTTGKVVNDRDDEELDGRGGRVTISSGSSGYIFMYPEPSRSISRLIIRMIK